jgi:hypothetical protein
MEYASDSTTRPNRLHTHAHSPKRLAHPRSLIPPLSTLTARATLKCARRIFSTKLAGVGQEEEGAGVGQRRFVGPAGGPSAHPPRVPCSSSTDAPAWPKPNLFPPADFDGVSILALFALSCPSSTGASGPPALGGSTVSVHSVAVWQGRRRGNEREGRRKKGSMEDCIPPLY